MGISSLRELRVKIGTTFNTSFTNAAATDWNTDNSTKIRATEIDTTGLVQEGLEDETVQARKYAKKSPHPGLRKGSVKFTMYADGAPSGVTAGGLGNLLEAAMGGIQNPTNARSTTAAASVSSTNISINSADTYAVAGQAVLVGTKGDGRGGGEVKIIDEVGVNFVSVWPACAGTPLLGDSIVFSTTAYLDDDSAKNYVDGLIIGDDSADQRQWIGGSPVFTVEGTAPGELPTVSFDFTVGDHQYVEASGDRASFDHAAAVTGGDPAHERAIGLVHIGDSLATARTSRQVGDISISPSLELFEKPEPGGVNGVGGHERAPAVPEMEMSLLFDQDMPGLSQDFNAGTAKSAIVQFGYHPAGTFAVEMQRCFLADLPRRDDLDGLTVSKIKIRADEDYSVGNTDLNRSALRIHRF